ncbi:MAG: VanZ family protein [Lachnospiraceae bacterium]|nr:VanZ family protein [Lachnospiraceae bacterium]MCI7191140.1 VanZ family protein [Lachnospiraceae bacterium]MDD7627062.1 VanZ family protein [Lachnospiraceae bacterium]MDY4118949.1 VanZ family protein [Lachnospiraceae bacterium]
MGSVMYNKKSHPVLIIFLWICFLSVVGMVAYLSFQSGEDARAFGKQLIQYGAEKVYQEDSVSEAELLGFTYLIRQSGRVLAFFLIGVLGTLTIQLSFPKWNWLIKTIFTAALLMTIACLTERLKIYIPSRHYSYEEMVYSIIATGAGFLLVTLFTLLFHIMKGFFKLLFTSLC